MPENFNINFHLKNYKLFGKKKNVDTKNITYFFIKKFSLAKFESIYLLSENFDIVKKY